LRWIVVKGNDEEVLRADQKNRCDCNGWRMGRGGMGLNGKGKGR